MILVFGDINLDVVIRADSQLSHGSDTTGAILTTGGGSAANVAAWAAFLGAPVAFSGRVGRDHAGDLLLGELSDRGIESLVTRDDSVPTGVIAAFVDPEGERTMVTSRGANLTFTEGHVSADAVARARHVHLTGYSFFAGAELRAAAMALLSRALEAGVPTSIDPSSYALLENYGVKRFLSDTAGCKIIFPNIDEGRLLTEADDPEAIVSALAARYDTVVLTLGSEGCIAGRGNDRWRASSHAPEVVDTTGAGDAFAGAFLAAGVARGLDPPAAAESAAAAAATCVGAMGARPPLSRRARRE